ncbi:hypothetical protein SUGI_0504620 [Cryptomeria japonica]|uniref:uncharacterized protein LOC131036029 n=1 Tax=Cryptomeria japonica TaxID=3369 RepID=UPI002408BC09|nr:uncharacterized protein LOC131036029 [Cryptomeria japonica]GLJ26259.1 hypothetical protein SUGI_0504620 [Cryptomeria japonica]
MSGAIVCGKRSFVEDSSNVDSSYPISKKFRCSTVNSPVCGFSSGSRPPNPTAGADGDCNTILYQNINIPATDSSRKTGSDLGHPIQSLQKSQRFEDQIPSIDGTVVSAPVYTAGSGSEWVELLLREMQNACNMDDARVRSSSVLQAFEKAIVGSTLDDLHKENTVLKDRVEGLSHDNNILKRAVAIQHERLRQNEESRGRELQELKKCISEYEERIRGLELNNYALTAHLHQADAQQSNSILGGFHHSPPDVF